MNPKELAAFACIGCMALAVVMIRLARGQSNPVLQKVFSFVAYGFLIPSFFLMIYVVF